MLLIIKKFKMFNNMKTGIEQIKEERVKQISKYNRNGFHDSAYVNGELVKAALAYLSICVSDKFGGNLVWPWDTDSFKDEGYVENLKKAGALIAAELDRLNVS